MAPPSLKSSDCSLIGRKINKCSLATSVSLTDPLSDSLTLSPGREVIVRHLNRRNSSKNEAPLNGKLFKGHKVHITLLNISVQYGFDLEQNTRQVHRLFSRFQQLDHDNTQYLTKEDLHHIKEIILNPVGDRIVDFFFVGNIEHLTFPMFARIFAIFRPLKKHTPNSDINSRESKLKLLFSLVDSNEDGSICKEDLFELLEMMMGAKLGEEQLHLIVDRVLSEADEDQDGLISLDEFRKVTEDLDVQTELSFISFS
ncbi:calcineurin B homologous protein 1-like isoform X1 [Tigriopus californicus]|uniref:calcineurin B homologous protein 1-like isoform X1 n=1 Tax=Tigriopus californicus TaxID=6832 RepID=UPI0027D9EBB0|nr:calcineurin B homologous protein 1-like isoform X1 [Tigriopus californicus]